MPIDPWAYEDSTRYHQDLAARWAKDALAHVDNTIIPHAAALDGHDPALVPQAPSMHTQPLINEDSVLHVPDWVKQASDNFVTKNGLAQPKTKGHGLLNTLIDTVPGTIYHAAEDVASPILSPILRLQNLENRYVAHPLARGVYSGVRDLANTAGAGLPDYEHLPGIIRTAFETVTAPSTWLAPTVLAKAVRFAPGLAATLPAAKGLLGSEASTRGFAGVLLDFIPSQRRVVETLAGAAGGAIGGDLAQRVGAPPLIGGIVGGGLAATAAGRGFRTPIERLGAGDRAKVLAHISSQEPPPSRGSVEYYMRMSDEEFGAVSKELNKAATRGADLTSTQLAKEELTRQMPNGVLEATNTDEARPQVGDIGHFSMSGKPAYHMGSSDFKNWQEAEFYRSLGTEDILDGMDNLRKEYYDKSDAGDMPAALRAASDLRRYIIEADRRGLTRETKGRGPRMGIQQDQSTNWDEYRQIAKGGRPPSIEEYLRMPDDQFDQTVKSEVRNWAENSHEIQTKLDADLSHPRSPEETQDFNRRYNEATQNPPDQQARYQGEHAVFGQSSSIDLTDLNEAVIWRRMETKELLSNIDKYRKDYYDLTDANNRPGAMNAQTQLRRAIIEAQRRGLISSEEKLPGNAIVSGEESGQVYYHGTDGPLEGGSLTENAWLTPNRADAEAIAKTQAKLSGKSPVVYKFQVKPGAVEPADPNSLAGSRGSVTIKDPAGVTLVPSEKEAALTASRLKDAQRIANSSVGQSRNPGGRFGKLKANRDLMDSIIIQKAKRGVPLTDDELAHADSTDMLRRLGGKPGGPTAGIQRYEEPSLDPRTAEILGIGQEGKEVPQALYTERNELLRERNALNSPYANNPERTAEIDARMKEIETQIERSKPPSDAMRQALSGEDLGSATTGNWDGVRSQLDQHQGVTLQNGAQLRPAGVNRYSYVPPGGKGNVEAFNSMDDAIQYAAANGGTPPGSEFTDINQQVRGSKYAQMGLRELDAERTKLRQDINEINRGLDNDVTHGLNPSPAQSVSLTDKYNELRQVESWIQQKGPGGNLTGQFRGILEPPDRSVGAAGIPVISAIFNNLNALQAAGRSTFNLEEPYSAILSARQKASLTQKWRAMFFDHSPKVVSDAAKAVGLRLEDHDANLLIDNYSRFRGLGGNFANGASTTIHLALQSAFDVATDGTVQNVKAATRYQGRFIRAPNPTPIFAELVHDRHLYNLTPAQSAALNAATAPLDEVRDLLRAFLVKTSDLPDGHFWPTAEDPRAPGRYLDTRESTLNFINQSFSQMSNTWLRESLKTIGSSRKIETALGNLPRVGASNPGTIESLNSFFRPLMATGDVSFAGVNGLLSFFNNPSTWVRSMRAATMGGIDDLTQAMHQKGSFRSFLEAGGVWKARNDIGEFGFRSVFENLPGPAGKFFQWANSTYNDFGNAVRILNYDNALPLAKTLTDQRALARYANLMSGIAAHSPTKFENVTEFAPGFFRSSLGLLSDAATSGGLDGKLARQTLTKTLLGAAFLTYGINEMQGKPTDFNPASPNFLKIHALDKSISLLGPYDTLLRAGSYLAQDHGDPTKAALYLSRAKSSPVMGRLWDLIEGETFAGKAIQFDNPHDVLHSILAESQQIAAPIAFQNTAQDIARHGLNIQTLGTSALAASGLKASDLSLSQRRDQFAQDEKGKSWGQLSPAEKYQLEQLRPDITAGVSQGRTSKAYAARRAISDRFSSQQSKLDDTIPPGTAWRNAHSDLLQQQAGAYDQWEFDHPDLAKQQQDFKASNPNDQALNDYFKTFAQAKQEGWTPDELSQGLDTLAGTWSPTQQKYVDDNTGLKNTPTVKEYRADQKVLRPYWSLEDQIWSQLKTRAEAQGSATFHDWILARTNSLLESGVAPGQVTQQVNRLPLVTAYNHALENLRLRYRVANPAAEAALEKWYGYAPLHAKGAPTPLKSSFVTSR